MSYDRDSDLLDEIKNERNTENTKASLISLFEGDKNAVFTPSTAFGFVATILSVVIVGALWWSSVNTQLDQLTNRQDELFSLYENFRSDFDTGSQSIYNNINAIKKALDDLETTYDTDKRISESEIQQKILNITVQVNDLSSDLNEIFKLKNETELYKRDMQYTIERLNNRIKRLEESLSNR